LGTKLEIHDGVATSQSNAEQVPQLDAAAKQFTVKSPELVERSGTHRLLVHKGC
jgi:hypothetical protein